MWGVGYGKCRTSVLKVRKHVCVGMWQEVIGQGGIFVDLAHLDKIYQVVDNLYNISPTTFIFFLTKEHLFLHNLNSPLENLRLVKNKASLGEFVFVSSSI